MRCYKVWRTTTTTTGTTAKTSWKKTMHMQKQTSWFGPVPRIGRMQYNQYGRVPGNVIVIDVSLFLVHVYRVLTVYMLCYTPATYTNLLPMVTLQPPLLPRRLPLPNYSLILNSSNNHSPFIFVLPILCVESGLPQIKVSGLHAVI